jgi:hypothetical protein
MLWRFKSCGKCGGDLIAEDDEWRCVHCGRYYYPNVSNVARLFDPETAHSRRGTPSCGVARGSTDTLAGAKAMADIVEA